MANKEWLAFDAVSPYRYRMETRPDRPGKVWLSIRDSEGDAPESNVLFFEQFSSRQHADKAKEVWYRNQWRMDTAHGRPWTKTQ